MAKITKRVVDAAGLRQMDYVIWDDELPGFGLGVFSSGKRTLGSAFSARVRELLAVHLQLDQVRRLSGTTVS